MKRSEVRESIFKLLFRIEFNSMKDMDDQVRLFFEDDVEADIENGEEGVIGADIPEKEAEYIKEKYEKIIERLPEIDSKIAEKSKGWSVNRIAKVDIAILRLAVYEMLFDEDIPVGVAIDEAVELAKKFGQDNSFSFVNGILSSISKEI